MLNFYDRACIGYDYHAVSIDGSQVIKYFKKNINHWICGQPAATCGGLVFFFFEPVVAQ